MAENQIGNSAALVAVHPGVSRTAVHRGCVIHLPQLLVLLDTLLPPKGVPAVLQEEALSSGTSASMTLPPPGEGDCTGVAPSANAPARHCMLEAWHAVQLRSTAAE